MNTQNPYLTQYCNLLFEWESMKIDIDNANESQRTKFSELQNKALEQSGLTLSELTLISLCRQYKTLRYVKSYALRIKNIY